MLTKLLAAVLVFAGIVRADSKYFAIEVIDEQSGRGVPMVELETPSKVRFITDSAGLIAIDDPAMMDRRVFFRVLAFGYEAPADGFGTRGVGFDVKAGQTGTIKVKRLNIAERLYRVTGEGIYRDSVLLGRKVPLAHPLINAEVVGQDSVQSEIYRGKARFFWGDTAKQSYVLGLFQTAGATGDLPDKGGLDPSVGVNLNYFTGKDGFARAMASMPEKGLVWIDGVTVLHDDKGQERMLCHASRLKDLGNRLGRYLMVYNDEKESFETLKQIDLDSPLSPVGYPSRVKRDGKEYFYYNAPFPTVRVEAKWDAVQDLSLYEGFTPLKPGAKYSKEKPPVDRDANGKLVFDWKRGTAALSSQQLKELIDGKHVKADELPFRLRDVDTDKPVLLHGGSFYWNDYRKKWIMIGLQGYGDSFLGEVYYAESDQPEGPWTKAKKIVTHCRPVSNEHGSRQEKMDFYNPKQHPFFDQQGGKIIYFEGTYTNTFSGNPWQTPRYEYNQVMYRLDLSDPRLEPTH